MVYYSHFDEAIRTKSDYLSDSHLCKTTACQLKVYMSFPIKD